MENYFVAQYDTAFKTKGVSHFPPFHNDFSYKNLTLILSISFSCNLQARIMQTRWNNENEAGN